jgi:hypothetical protein
MTKHKDTRKPVTGRVARRKRGYVRLQDPITARMGGWVKDPETTPSYAQHIKSLELMTVAELKDLARTRGVAFKSKDTKPTLIAALSA